MIQANYHKIIEVGLWNLEIKTLKSKFNNLYSANEGSI